MDEKERLDAHKLIEEFMVLANVAAAETLIRQENAASVPGARGAEPPEKLDRLA